METDHTYLKAHLLFGKILCQLAKDDSDTTKIETSITRMKKSLTLCPGQGHRDFEVDIEKNMFRAQKLLYYKRREIEQQKKWKNLQHFKRLIFSPNPLTPLKGWFSLTKDSRSASDRKNLICCASSWGTQKRNLIIGCRNILFVLWPRYLCFFLCFFLIGY